VASPGADGGAPSREPEAPSTGTWAGAAERTWTVLSLIHWSAEYLTGKGVEQARLDAEHLLAHALRTGRLQLYLQYDRPLTPDELAAYRPLLRRRARREPLQYVVGRAAFRELDLHVDPRVLVPRPETEQLVELVLTWARGRSGLSALDVGTGSGCIALSLAREGPFERIVATDPSRDALEVAGLNAAGVEGSGRIELRPGALFAPVAGERFDVVVSNPPYVADEDAPGLQPEVRDWEPGAALFGGPGGLEVVSALVEGAAEHLEPGGLLALEVGDGQTEAVAAHVTGVRGFGEPTVRRDLSGRRRFVTACRDG
jgi:release factor glutamine methyltransferase